MEDKRQIGIAIPTYQRDEVLFESFAQIYNDPRLKQIVICDDASDIDIFHSIREKCLSLPKVSLSRNLTNQDCFRNKKNSISFSDQEWNILGDSDNIFGTDYLDTIFSTPEWDEKTIYTPSFAAPYFDFRAYEGLTISKENVAEHIDKPMLETCLNANNFFVNKHEYLRVRNLIDLNIDPVTSDSVFFCLEWLKAGNNIHILKDLQYFHRVWESSHYRTQNHRTPVGFHESILKQLRELK